MAWDAELPISIDTRRDYRTSPSRRDGDVIDPSNEIGLIGLGASGAAYVGLTLLLFARWKPGTQSVFLATACLLTAAWAVVSLIEHLGSENQVSPVSTALGMAHLVTWVMLLTSFVHPLVRDLLSSFWGRLSVGAGVLSITAWLIIDLLQPWAPGVVMKIHLTAQLATAVLGLSLIEVILRNASADERWRIKFFAIGLGGMFVCNMFVAADALLFDGIRSILSDAWGLIYVLLAPIIGISIRRFGAEGPGVSISRKAAFYASTLTASGLYLCVMAAAAYYVKEVGGNWGDVIQAVFLFGAIVLLLVVLSSGAFRARLRVYVRKHFYKYRYDYREEWLRFISTISSGGRAEPLERRVVKGIADVVDSPAGALWLADGTVYTVASTWNLTAASVTAKEAASLVTFLERRGWVVDLGEAARDPDKYDSLEVPTAISAIQHAWAVLPLLHEQHVFGLVLLTEPRAPRTLDWEDYDLLRAIGHQAASYLAEHSAARQLAETKQFDKFNRRFAFVLHDIKNLASRFSLIAANVEKHGDKPEFRRDVVATIQDASAQMTRLMQRIGSEVGGEQTTAVADLSALIEHLTQNEFAAPVNLATELGHDDLAVAGDIDRLGAILRHLLQNAAEATGPEGQVSLSVNVDESAAIVEITDDGPGMEDDYIRNQLFKPFRSTKSGGFGLGAFQCREYARELGGDLEVISSPGSGTTMRVVLPVARAGRVHNRQTRMAG
jgi:putative PEP-CTERM system histidine kinase